MFAEYRVTRPRLYGPGTAGYFDSSAREGYYVIANDENHAKDRIRRRLHLPDGEPLEVKIWSKAKKWDTVSE